VHGGKDLDGRHPAALVVVAVLVCALATLAVTFLPFVRFAYRAPSLHVSLETTNALVTLLVAYLVYGRFRDNRRLQDLLLSLALCTVATANLVLTALPTALSSGQDAGGTDRAATVTRLLGIVVLAAAAIVPRGICVQRRSTVTAIAVMATLAVAASVVVLTLALASGPEPALPPGIFQEFKGTGNMELVLDRKISDQRIYPAVDIFLSGTRREELLLQPWELEKINLIRRGLAGHKPGEAIERLLMFVKKFPTNAQMLKEIPG